MTTYVRPVNGTFTIKRGDTEPGIEIVLPSWIDPIASAGTIFVTERATGVSRVAAPCQLVQSGADVVARYAWAAADTVAAGIFDVEVEVALPGGGTNTTPGNGYFQMLIDADLGAGVPVGTGVMTAAGSGAMAAAGATAPVTEGAMASAGSGAMSGVGASAPNTAGVMTAAGAGGLAGVGATVPVAAGVMSAGGSGAFAGEGATVPNTVGDMASDGAGSFVGAGASVPVQTGAMAASGGGVFAGVGASVPISSGDMASAGSGTFAGIGSSVVPPASIAITSFSADKIIFDSGAHLGQNAAAVPLSGTGTVGEIVEGRAVSVDDAGATTTAWADVDVVAGGGTWAGTINAPRSASWYRPEVRIKSQPAVAAQGTNRFGSGHMWAIWGQSEISNAVSAAYSLTTPVAVSDPEAVQVYHGAGAVTPTTTRTLITTGTPLTAAMAAMASTLIGERPGEKFAIIMQAKAGTDPRSLSNDGDTSRLWSVDKALHDFATADGRKVGLAAMSWFASPGSLAAAYGEAMFPLFAKKTLAGADVTIPGTVSYTGGNYQADHWFGELYDYTHTKWVPYGPHRFDPTGDLLDATHDVGGAINTTLKAKEDSRAAWRAMLAVPSATMFLPLGMDITTYSNGVSDGSGGWTDEPHPSGWTDDGQPQWMRLSAAMLMEAAGLTSWAAPEFDNCLWEAAGAYVEVWSSEGPITTTRIARSEAALPATFPHWTEVAGFQINGIPAQNATIVAGRVRITPNGGGNFIFSDVINFGEGGATGQIQHPEDNINAFWKNLPIVDVGLTGLDGVPVRPIPNVATLANTLPATSNFTTVAGRLTRFRDPVNWPTTDNKITFEVDILIPSFAATNHLCEMDNVHIGLQVAPNSNLFLQIKDSAGTSIFGSASIGTVTAGVRFSVRIAANITTNELWTTINGVTTTRSLLANTGQFASAGRGLTLLSRSSGTSNNAIGTVYSLKVWNDVAAGGGVPASGLLVDVSGPAATANAHPWKLPVGAGGDVV